jgi:hypothetical protein
MSRRSISLIAPLFNSLVGYNSPNRVPSAFKLFSSCPVSRSSSVSLASRTMADLKVELNAPNGKKITLPTGLFINNEFVKATGGQTITSISPT